MQRHVDIYRHKVIMGLHNKLRRDKHGDPIDNTNMSSIPDNDNQSASFSAMDLEN